MPASPIFLRRTGTGNLDVMLSFFGTNPGCLCSQLSPGRIADGSIQPSFGRLTVGQEGPLLLFRFTPVFHALDIKSFQGNHISFFNFVVCSFPLVVCTSVSDFPMQSSNNLSFLFAIVAPFCLRLTRRCRMRKCRLVLWLVANRGFSTKEPSEEAISLLMPRSRPLTPVHSSRGYQTTATLGSFQLLVIQKCFFRQPGTL